MQAPPRAIVVISDGARDGGQVAPDDAAQQAKRQGVPVYSVLVGTQNGVVTEKLTGGYRRIIRVPPDPETLRRSRRRPAASSSPRRTPRACAGLRGARLASRNAQGGSRDHGRVRRRSRTILLLAGASRPPFSSRGAVRAAAALGALLVAGAAALVARAPGRRGERVRRAQVCVPVPGPWVVVPASTAAPRPRSSGSSPARAGTSSAGSTRGSAFARSTSRSSARSGARSTRGSRRRAPSSSSRTYAGQARCARRPSGRSSAACPRQEAARASDGVHDVPARKPVTRRVRLFAFGPARRSSSSAARAASG